MQDISVKEKQYEKKTRLDGSAKVNVAENILKFLSEGISAFCFYEKKLNKIFNGNDTFTFICVHYSYIVYSNSKLFCKKLYGDKKEITPLTN